MSIRLNSHTHQTKKSASWILQNAFETTKLTISFQFLAGEPFRILLMNTPKCPIPVTTSISSGVLGQCYGWVVPRSPCPSCIIISPDVTECNLLYVTIAESNSLWALQLGKTLTNITCNQGGCVVQNGVLKMIETHVINRNDIWPGSLYILKWILPFLLLIMVQRCGTDYPIHQKYWCGTQ